MAASATNLHDRVAAVRRFNRFYTQHLGVLRQGWLDSPFSLTEARVLYEIKARGGAPPRRRAQRGSGAAQTTATEIGRELGLDAGYLSRMLRRFDKLGLIRRQTSPDDGRQSFLSLTDKG